MLFAALVAAASLVLTKPDALFAPALHGLPLVEPHVVVSPTDPDRILVGAIVASPDRSGPWRCAAFTSGDRGRTWSRHDFAIDRCIDPWVLLLEDGTALFAAVEIARGVEGDERFRLVVGRSEDGGDTWPVEPDSRGSAYEHPILVQDEQTVYLAARRMRRAANGAPRHTIGVERSTDGGRNFEALAEVEPGDLALIATGLSVADERVVVTFLDFQRNVDGFDREGILAHPRAWALVSRDGGVSFAAPKLVSEACGMRGSFPGYPFSTSDPGVERVIFACVRPNLDGVVRHLSTDGGEIWSDALRIDGGSPHVRTPMLAVGHDGTIAAAWYDRRLDPAARCQDLYVSASVDHGTTFDTPIRVSTEPSCPDESNNGRVAESWSMGGDYSSIAVGTDGAFHVVWADSRSGLFQLHLATFEVPSETAGHGHVRLSAEPAGASINSSTS